MNETEMFWDNLAVALNFLFEKKLLAAFILTIFTIAAAAGYLANLL